MIEKYDLYGQVAYPKHHKQIEVAETYHLPAKTKSGHFLLSRKISSTLHDEDDGSGREWDFKVVIKLASHADLHHLRMFLYGASRCPTRRVSGAGYCSSGDND